MQSNSHQRIEPSRDPDTELCSDFLEAALTRASSVFQQLVYLAGRRNASGDDYRDATLDLAFGRTAADATLKRYHNQAFRQWLCLGLERQTTDLASYLDDEQQPREALSSWMRSRWYERLVPENASDVERTLFSKDLEIALPLLDRDK